MPTVRRAGVADDRAEVGRVRVGSGADALRNRAGGPRVHAGHDDVVDLVRRDAGGLQRIVDRLRRRAARRPARRSAPPTRATPARRAGASGRGTRRWRSANVTSSAMTSSWSAHRKAALPSPPSRSSAPPGRPVRTSAGHREDGVRTRRCRAPSGSAPSAPRRRRRRSSPTESRPSAAWMAVAFVLSRYGGDAVENSTTAGVTPSGAARIARRAASTPIDVESSSYDATARVPLPPPVPSAAPIAGSLQPPVRHVGAVGDDPSGHESPFC